MKRIVVTEEHTGWSDYDEMISHKWFDVDKAERFDEDSRWNGNNHISCATGSQWEHEALFRTVTGRYILNHWSNYQGSLETYHEITVERAADWLVANGFDLVDENPDKDKELATAYAALEIK